MNKTLMNKTLMNKTLMNKTFFSVISLAMLAVVCVLAGYFLGHHRFSKNNETDQQAGQVSRELEELVLKADTASSGKKIAMATGSLDGNIDVVFTLDYESGNLYAWLPGPSGFLGEWSVNVAAAIGLEKGSNPDLVLTVANFNVRSGNSGALRDAPLVVYVANGENGKVAGYGFQWNSQLAKNGTFQKSILVPAYQGSTREQTIKRQ